ncbi:Uncharacterised protein [Flavonifractor plautii]|uniref:Uncharacterized protein n=1 Tax=Flavonifractor plautii TaxID=292800 RepID=A0A174L2G5_FLAPL|nr:Uncharacterised protein [Flavonifractor plautii]
MALRTLERVYLELTRRQISMSRWKVMRYHSRMSGVSRWISSSFSLG